LNEIKYDYVDSKQHFYQQYHVTATDMCNTQDATSGDSKGGLGGPWPPQFFS